MITWKQLCQAVLTGTAAIVYTAPVGTSTAIHQASVWNPTSGVVALKIYIAPAAGSAADATTVWNVNVPATTSVPIPQIIGHKLQAGMEIFASGNGLTLTISGAESVQ